MRGTARGRLNHRSPADTARNTALLHRQTNARRDTRHNHTPTWHLRVLLALRGTRPVRKCDCQAD